MSVHGTHAGYQRHTARGETPCDQCRAAATDYMRAYRRRKGQPHVQRLYAERDQQWIAALRDPDAATALTAIIRNQPNAVGDINDWLAQVTT